jgi:hypothetical protein
MNPKRIGDLAERIQFRVRRAVFDPANKLLINAGVGRERAGDNGLQQ